MIKKISLSNGCVIKYNPKNNSGFEEVLSFYEPKINTMIYNWRNVPEGYDKEDLIQTCRIKLLDALNQFDIKKNINFSTYVYTIWHRKLSQIFSKYKGKKYSSYIKNDKYVNSNHGLDRKNSAYYLQIKKDKCPISKNFIDKKSCKNCEHHVKYSNRKIIKGHLKGKIRKFTLCKYLSEVLSMRGIKSISLNSPLKQNEDIFLLNIIPCNKQNKIQEEKELQIDLDKLKNYMGKNAYKVLELIHKGMNKSEITQIMGINRIKLNKIISILSKNKKLKEILIVK